MRATPHRDKGLHPLAGNHRIETLAMARSHRITRACYTHRATIAPVSSLILLLATLIAVGSIPSQGEAQQSRTPPITADTGSPRSGSPTISNGTTEGASPARICVPYDSPECDTQPPTVSISPSGGTFSSASRSVTITWNDNNQLLSASRSITLNGQSVTSQFSYTPSGSAHGTSSGTVTLQPGSNSLSASILDVAYRSGYKSVTYTYQPPKPTVSVTADPDSVSKVATQLAVAYFNVASNGGPAGGATYTLAAQCSGTAWCGADSVTPHSVMITPGGTQSAAVHYRAGNDGTINHVRLTATYSLDATVHDSASQTVAAIAQCYGTVSTISPCAGGIVDTVLSGATGKTTNFTVTNAYGSEREYYSFACTTDAPLTDCFDSQIVDLDSAQSQTTAVSLGVGSGDGIAQVRLLVTGDHDQVAGTVKVAVFSPTSLQVATPVASARLDTGDSASHAFLVENQGSIEASYDLDAFCSGAAISCHLATTRITIAPGVTDTVFLSYHGGSPGDTGTVRLTATHTTLTSIASTASASVLVNTYGVAITPHNTSARVAVGTGHSYDFTVRNTGDATADFELSTQCVSPVNNCAIAADSIRLDPGDSAVVNVGFTANEPSVSGGAVRLRAEQVGDPDITDMATVMISAHSVGIGGQPEVALVNSSTLSAPEQCLTISAGMNAAYECGDLRVVHALPSIRTMNKERTPTLLYTSGSAEPHVLVAMDVTLPSDTTTPQSVEAVVQRNGVTQGSVASWSGSGWAPGTTRRLVVGFDEDSLPTGVYEYTLQVTNVYPSLRRPAPVITGHFVVVNRAASPFGAGWWLAGLEQLSFPATDTTSRLWVGGDGSVRLYSKMASTAGSATWIAPALDRPDSLTWDSATNRYTRHLRHGLRVEFDSLGYHVSTINRLEQETSFLYDATYRLASIILPPTSAAKSYTFDFDTPNQVTITAPAIGDTSRVTTLLLNGGRVTAIQDPDYQFDDDPYPHPYVAFGYDGSSGRITSRTNKLGTVTSYVYGPGQTLASVHIPLDTVHTATTTFAAAEAQGLTDSVFLADSISTLLDGPREEVADVTRFWLDRFGAPSKIVDALDQETLIERMDADYPALSTRLVQPNGHVMKASYDANANLVAVTDSTPYGDGRSAVTRYGWDPKWEFVTAIIQPEGQVSHFSYAAANGNRIWQEDGRGSASRISFHYYDSGAIAGMLQDTELPGGASYSVGYDALGNVEYTETPLGSRVSFENDAIGRTVATQSPIDAAGNDVRVDSSSYDVMNRVVRTVSAGPALRVGIPSDSTGSRTLIVRNYYNPVGLLDSLHRSSSPDAAGIGTIKTAWGYDLAMRRIKETAPDGEVETMAYDLAGNLATITTRRDNLITMTYDALNRLASRVIPSVTYEDTLAAIGERDGEPYPLLPNSGNDYVIAGQTETFTYDALGHILTANNGDAHVTRTYFPNGSLATERQQLRETTGSSFSHDYLLGYSYDLNGSRTAVTLPSQLVPAGTRDSISWTYSPQTGALSSIVDPLGNIFEYGYNNRNEPISLAYPADYTEHWGYDDDGRIVGDTIFNTGGLDSLRYPDLLLRAMTLTYDARGKVLTTGDSARYHERTISSYTGLGALATHYSWQNGILDGLGIPSTYETSERQQYDALGNVYSAVTESWKNSTSIDWLYRPRSAIYQEHTGRLLAEFSGGGDKTYGYDESGNLIFSIREDSPADSPAEDRFTYYGADERIRAADYRFVSIGHSDESPENLVFEEYRYDALGRRVWVLTHREARHYSVFKDASYLEASTSTLRRTIWDGSRELIEIQVPVDESQSPSVLENDDLLSRESLDTGGNDPNPYFGRVVYTYGLAVDKPVAVTRYRYVDYFEGQQYTDFPPKTHSLFWTPAGRLGFVLCADESYICRQNGIHMGLDYPEALFAYDRPRFVQRTFQGTLIVDKQDAVGTLYRRNRVYDPGTGRFTQEDPIGLAGGMNLYGFADGDPVNYSDPFGLCPYPDGSPCDPIAQMVHDVNQRMTEAVVSLGLKTLEVLAAFGNAVTHVGDVTTLAGLNPTASNGDRAVAAVSLATGVATSAASGVRLAKQLASEELLGEARAGIGISMAGAGSRKSIDDIARLVSEYGGESGDWAKMTTRTRVVGGTPISVHWYENVTSGLRVEFKTPINR